MQYEVHVINVEVPVRVFNREAFVDNLRMQDFEIYENGVLQNIEAAYFINNEGLKRKEEVG